MLLLLLIYPISDSDRWSFWLLIRYDLEGSDVGDQEHTSTSTASEAIPNKDLVLPDLSPSEAQRTHELHLPSLPKQAGTCATSQRMIELKATSLAESESVD